MPAMQTEQHPLVPTYIELDTLFRDTWRIFWTEPLMCTLGVFLATMIFAVTALVDAAARTFLIEATDHFGVQLVGFVITTVAGLFHMWINIGQSMYLLAIARGEKPDLALLFQGMGYLWNIFLGYLMVGFLDLCCLAIALAPVALCAFAGLHDLIPIVFFFAVTFYGVATLYLFMVFWPYWYLIIDGRARGAYQALELAVRYSRGNRLPMTAVVFVVPWLLAAAAIVGVFLLIVGLVVTYFLALAFGCFLFPMAYLAMTGQPNRLDYEYTRESAVAFA